MDKEDVVYKFVRAVPPGKVVTYGQVAGLAEGVRLTARQVGHIMTTCPPDVPWHRVVGAGGTLPIGKRNPEFERIQRLRLKDEGVRFRDNGCVDMALSQMQPWVP